MKLKPVSSKRSSRLADSAARVRGDVKSGAALERASLKETSRISNLQRVFYADARHALLIVLQGRDAAGKDGTIRKVFSAVNPQGCSVSAFKAPTDTELHHDYLWRIHQQVPPRGMIGIFNRSHYEDVIVPRVRGWIDKKTCQERYVQINDFERMLSLNGVVILKFMLHISRDEQSSANRSAHRQIEELEIPLATSTTGQWDDFTKAYRGLLHTRAPSGRRGCRAGRRNRSRLPRRAPSPTQWSGQAQVRRPIRRCSGSKSNDIFCPPPHPHPRGTRMRQLTAVRAVSPPDCSVAAAQRSNHPAGMSASATLSPDSRRRRRSTSANLVPLVTPDSTIQTQTKKALET